MGGRVGAWVGGGQGLKQRTSFRKGALVAEKYNIVPCVQIPTRSSQTYKEHTFLNDVELALSISEPTVATSTRTKRPLVLFIELALYHKKRKAFLKFSNLPQSYLYLFPLSRSLDHFPHKSSRKPDFAPLTSNSL